MCLTSVLVLNDVAKRSISEVEKFSNNFLPATEIKWFINFD